MTRHERQLLVSQERCIGCRACAVVCPAGLITLSDSDSQRTVRLAALCAEDCTRCVGACPTQAISLPAASEGVAGQATVLVFALQACASCAAPVVTIPMLAHLRATVPRQIQADAEGQDWLRLCPQCRQKAEARQVAREGLLTRRLGQG